LKEDSTFKILLDANNLLKRIQASKSKNSFNPFGNVQVHHPWNKIYLKKGCDKVIKIDKYD